MDGNWKSKTDAVKTSSDKKIIHTALDAVKTFHKRMRDGDIIKEIEQEMKSIEKELSKMGDGRHNIRPKRILNQKLKDLQQKKKDYSNYDMEKINSVLDTRRPVKVVPVRKKIKQNSDDNRRRPSSHSRVIKVSRDKKNDNADIMIEDLVTELHSLNYVPPVYVSFSGSCSECGGQMQKLPTESTVVCAECGMSIPYLDSTARSSNHGDERSFPSFSYKKINHFRDWLKSVQAKESTTISPEIMQKVCKKCSEQRIKPEDLTPKKVREILKSCKLRKYYENSVLIYSLLTGVEAPRFKPEVEAQLETMFMQIAVPFEKAVKEVAPERKNFLSYAFVCFKFVQLLPDVDQRWLQSFALLKGRDKLYRQDQIWRHICKQLNWKFHPSV